jgi:hypothetical protein
MFYFNRPILIKPDTMCKLVAMFVLNIQVSEMQKTVHRVLRNIYLQILALLYSHFKGNIWEGESCEYQLEGLGKGWGEEGAPPKMQVHFANGLVSSEVPPPLPPLPILNDRGYSYDQIRHPTILAQKYNCKKYYFMPVSCLCLTWLPSGSSPPPQDWREHLKTPHVNGPG